MKKSLITIVLAVGFSLAAVHAAKADVVARAKGVDGNTIALLDSKDGCAHRPGTLDAAVYSKNGRAVAGCWNRVGTGNGAMVSVLWEDGERSLYPETTTWYFTDNGIDKGFMKGTPQNDAQRRTSTQRKGDYL